MKRGWCPTVHEPMPTGDGLLMRIKPPLGQLVARHARLIAETAGHAGNGIVELTARGNVQLRGLTPDSARSAATVLVEAGLADADPTAERQRNVILSPLARHDPGVAPGTIALAAEVEALLVGTPGLSPKFCVAIDGGGALPLAYPGDITVHCAEAARINIARGAATRQSILPSAPAMAAAVAREAVLPTLRRLLEACGGQRDSQAMLLRVALDWRPHMPSPRIEPVGFHRYDEAAQGAFGIALPFGETGAATLHVLADLADRFSGGILCLGPHRTVLLGSVRDVDTAAIASRATGAALIVHPGDPRLRVHACIGSRGCASGSVDARGDAARFARVPFEGTLHVSGCAKGCAHPRPATLTLVGENGSYRAERAA